jgi:hypothetical protein
MTREEFIKQRCEIDKITEEEFEKRYRVVKCNCGQPYCKGYRCLDLDGLLKENQELKKQLENYKKLGFKHLQDKNNNLETQQKDFIKYLELEKDCFVRRCSNVYEDGLGRTRLVNEDIFDEIDNILQKYREIIGGK